MRYHHPNPGLLLAALLLAIAAVAGLTSTNAHGQALATASVQKVCTGAAGTLTVPYASACPAGTKLAGKLCPSGVQVAYATACPAIAPAPAPTPSPTPAPVPASTAARKLCGDGSIVAYSGSCPAGSGTVRKICASGAIVAYASPCPAIVPVLAVGRPAIALSACPSLMNPADALTAGAAYKVEGFAGMVAPGAYPDPGTRDVVILSAADGKHLGDGWFAYWTPAYCVSGG